MREQEEAATREDQGEQDTGQDGGATGEVSLTHHSCGSSSALASAWCSPLQHSPYLESPAGTGQQAEAAAGIVEPADEGTGEQTDAGTGEQAAAGTGEQAHAATVEHAAAVTGEQAAAGTVVPEAAGKY